MTKKNIKVALKRTDNGNYTVVQITNAITVDILDKGKFFTVHVGNVLIEPEAEQIANSYAVTVR